MADCPIDVGLIDSLRFSAWAISRVYFLAPFSASWKRCFLAASSNANRSLWCFVSFPFCSRPFRGSYNRASIGCCADDFKPSENVIVPFKLGNNARKYLKEPITCNFVSYGNNVVVAAIPETIDVVSEYVGKFGFYDCFETPNMHWLNERLSNQGHKVCFMAEYYLPDINRIPDLSCAYQMRLLKQEDFEELYIPEWSNALCKNRKHLDVLGVGAYEGDTLIGLAACSADCEEMWQIGVDVLPQYRRQGIASALTSTLAKEILSRNKVPFYCTAWSNIRSVRNAVKSGFIPAWVEMTVKPAAIVDEMNR